MADILIIDDETSLANSLGFALRAEGYAVTSASTGEAGLAAAQASAPSLVLLDLRLPDGSGLDFLDRLRSALPDTPVVMISAHGDTRAAVQAVKRGAFDYLTKPFDLDDLLVTLRAATERQRMAQEIARYREAELARGEMVGESPPFEALLESVRRIGASSASRVLLLGESGTGKALVARAIHAHGARARGPFVEVNCASLPEHLIEAELFGAEKGSYTGADQKRVGLATLADGGTLFLDEVGELPLPLQAKLLHFLEDGSYRPIGSARSLTADARVIAATNRDLAAEVRAGAFREDLFYRLNVVQLRMPALRERGGDVLLLARHFAARYGRDERCAPVQFTPEAEAVLLAHRWPGNVRELRNLVERLTILGPGRSIGPDDLPPEMRAPTPSAATEGRSIGDELAETEKRLLEKALREAGGHRGRAAEILGISRHALKRRIQRLGAF
ncbi:MAG: NtrC-like response regulator [Anaeromyxobacteraceae bacterium]|nr:NtrC-like response regulator [Anaeromyxobacteraceae bacterium]